jgi:thioredoxin 1
LEDNEFNRELETIRTKKMEELSMSDTSEDWPDSPVKVTDSEFQDFIKKYPFVVLDCWAPWCGPCRMVGPVIEELAKDYKGKIVFGKLNTDENQTTAALHGIMSIPTLLFFKNGEPVDKVVGALPRQALEPKLKEHL